MKIIHCLNQYMPLAKGGTEIYTHTLATFQKRDGHNVAVITPHIEHYRPGQINEHYVYEGIDVYQFLETGNPMDRQVHYGKKKPEGLSNFVSLINQLKPDVIHFHELNRSIGFTIEHVKLAKQSGAKVFLTMHLPFYSCNTNTLIYDNNLCDGIIRSFRCSECSYKTLFSVSRIIAKPLARLSIASYHTHITEKLPDSNVKTLLTVPHTISRIKTQLEELWNHVDRLISLNKWYKKILLDNGVPENKVFIVPTALVSTTKRETNKSSYGLTLPLKMVFVGRIYPIKGIHLIIKALHLFSPEQVRIVIYGKPEDTLYYKQCINDSTNIKSISWGGELKREDVIDHLSQYDILCLPSTSSEMSPLVIQEAFEAGIPVLASKVYGNMELVKHGHNGLLFDFNSSKSLATQIQRLISKPDLLQKLKENIAPPQRFEKVNDAYAKLYALS